METKRGKHSLKTATVVWRLVAVFLLMMNVMGFGYYLLTINSEYGGIGLVILIPYLTVLAAIDLVSVVCFLYFYRPS
jgi:prepilin signal peptidase PulO-like enzyme (type II secretory pathway)